MKWFRPARKFGMLLLAIWLILHGLLGFIHVSVPPELLYALALLAGVLLILDR